MQRAERNARSTDQALHDARGDRDRLDEETKARLTNLQTELERSQKLVSELTSKGSRYDALQLDFVKVSKEKEDLSSLIQDNSSTLKTMAVEKADVSDRTRLLETQNLALEKDKDHLQRQINRLEDQLENTINENLSLDAKITSMKEKKKTLLEKLEEEQMNSSKKVREQ